MQTILILFSFFANREVITELTISPSQLMSSFTFTSLKEKIWPKMLNSIKLAIKNTLQITEDKIFFP